MNNRGDISKKFLKYSRDPVATPSVLMNLTHGSTGAARMLNMRERAMRAPGRLGNRFIKGEVLRPMRYWWIR